MKNTLQKNWKLFLLASLTLGLAPFNPPHIWGKIQWIIGGNAFSGKNAMQAQDYFDVLLTWLSMDTAYHLFGIDNHQEKIITYFLENWISISGKNLPGIELSV